MSYRLWLAGIIICGFCAPEAEAQGGGAPSIIVKVNKSPGGKGTIMSYDLENETLLVSLKAPGGRTNQVEVNRHHISPRAWRALSDLAQVNREADDKSLVDEPIEVEVKYIPGGKGTIVAYNADTHAVVVDFNGQQSREIPVGQLKSRTWKAAREKLARSVPPTNKKDETSQEPDN